MEGYTHCCPKVYRGDAASIKRLAAFLEQKYKGSKTKGEWLGLATTMAGTNDGSINGFWGYCSWVHQDGQQDDGDV